MMSSPIVFHRLPCPFPANVWSRLQHRIPDDLFAKAVGTPLGRPSPEPRIHDLPGSFCGPARSALLHVDVEFSTLWAPRFESVFRKVPLHDLDGTDLFVDLQLRCSLGLRGECERLYRFYGA